MSTTTKLTGIRVEVDTPEGDIREAYDQLVEQNPTLPWGEKDSFSDEDSIIFSEKENIGKLIMIQSADSGKLYLVKLIDYEYEAFDIFSVIGEDAIDEFKEWVNQIFGEGSLESGLREVEAFALIYYNGSDMPF